MHPWQVWGKSGTRPTDQGTEEHRIQSDFNLDKQSCKAQTNITRLVPKFPEFQYRVCLSSSQASN